MRATACSTPRTLANSKYKISSDYFYGLYFGEYIKYRKKFMSRIGLN